MSTLRTERLVRRHTVIADDGVPLAVHELGAAGAPLTAVFVHGHCGRTETWTPLRDSLIRRYGATLRMVFFDHRGHGASGTAGPETYTVEQLGRDLAAVLRAVSAGPVVLVGHSMGGMTILSYARQHPHEIGTRVAGVCLIGTAAGDLGRSGLGRYLDSPAVALFHRAVRHAPGAVQRALHLGGRAVRPLRRTSQRRASGSRWAALLAVLANDTPVVTMAAFLRSFAVLDESAALAVLAAVPAVVLCGSADEWTPFELSAGLAERLPRAELVRVDGAGHSVITDRPAEVARALGGLLQRVG
ncbi:alpha/beta hydrolase [Rhodococcus sp. CSLK01-03]|uniref:Alpha/beta hydrolase n=1 Tax=Rhodococcus indonesiensis TaxID=3055869 RepID=A0ABT7RRB3_9NOCA|nr:alpha/beta hydrolase [Rhodococcus indonesiensis]MDM7490192.1 alpha/beta hydrolase [Rhodococcus indonesiensis]